MRMKTEGGLHNPTLAPHLASHNADQLTLTANVITDDYDALNEHCVLLGTITKADLPPR